MLSGKCPVGEMSVWGNVLVGKYPVGEVSCQGIVLSGKCPSGKFPSGKCQPGNCPLGSVSRGTVQSGNCPHTTLNVDNILKSLTLQNFHYQFGSIINKKIKNKKKKN